MAESQSRQPRGVPAGGEYAGHERSESAITLENDPSSEAGEWEYAPQDTFTFDAIRLSTAISKIDKANKKLARAGVDERFTYETESKVVFSHKTNLNVERTTLTLNRPVLGHDGWKFEGAFDFTPDGDVVRAYSLDSNVNDPTDAHCDVCNTNRQRERVYSLRNEDGETNQVGSTCLASFLGIRPEGLWALDYDPEFAESEEDDESNYGVSLGHSVYPSEELLAATLAASDNGKTFMSRSRASWKEPATADTVMNHFIELKETVTDKQRAEARRIIKWVKSLPADGDDSYNSNLKSLLIPRERGAEKWVKWKHIPTAASAVSSYYSAKDREAQAKNRQERKALEVKGYLAEPKAKIADVPATVESARYLSNQDYPSTIVKLLTDDGHVVTWFASGFKEFEAGQKVNVKGTVKANEEYQGSFQTVITRAKLTDQKTGELQG